jgi:hypothetical protein
VNVTQTAKNNQDSGGLVAYRPLIRQKKSIDGESRRLFMKAEAQNNELGGLTPFLQLPSGKVLEREILDFERMIEEAATSTRESSSRGSVVFTFADEPGEAVLKISIARLEGDVKIERVNLVVKRRE